MKAVTILAALMAVAASPSAHAAPEPSFVCPDAQPNKAAREAEMDQFIQRMFDRHVAYTAQDIIRLRIQMLKEHGCWAELQRIARNHPHDPLAR